MTFWRQTVVALALAAAPARSIGAQVTVGGFETEGSVGLSRDDYDALGRALSALLTAEVGGRSTARLVPIRPVTGSKAGEVDLGAARTAAAQGGAKVLVVGSLLDQYGDIHIEARMIDAATGEPIAVIRGDPKLAKREQLAQAIADLADRLADQPGVGGRRVGPARAGVPVEALVGYGKGLRYEDAGDRTKAAEAFRVALRGAPGFTEAGVALRRVGG